MPVYVIDTLKPKNGLDFAVVEAVDVAVEGYLNLADAVTHFATDAMIEAINTALSGKANTSDVNTSVANLQGQIDQIVISASAEAVVAPEVVQARVDADGTAHTTLKDRLDADDEKARLRENSLFDSIKIMNSDRILNDVSFWGNMNPNNIVIENGLVELNDDTPNRITTNIRFDVENYSKIVAKIASGFKIRVLFWVNSGEFTYSFAPRYKYVVNPNEDDLRVWQTEDRTIIVPEGAKGMTVSVAKSDDTAISPSDCTAVKVYIGTLINEIAEKQDAFSIGAGLHLENATMSVSKNIEATMNMDLDNKPIEVSLESGAVNPDGSDASLEFESDSCRTEYFKCGSSLEINVEFSDNSQQTPWYININYYDNDKNFISRIINSYSISGAVTETLSISNTPQGTVYARISYTFKPIGDVVSHIISTNNPTPLLVQVSDLSETVIKKGIFLGDSISFGVYSYYDEHGDRKNADDDTAVLANTRADVRISDWFSIFANAEMDNIARRGTGYVADSRHLGNGWDKAQITDFSEYDFCALCFGVNDYIQKKELGDIQTSEEGTVIGNMMRILNKIYTDNPYCKVVVFTPYNTWGQWRDTEGAAQVLYGDFASNYALGYSMGVGGNTLQDVVDAINSVCNYYGIESVDLNKGNFINRINIKDILVDGLHPTAASMKALASEMYCNMTFR